MFPYPSWYKDISPLILNCLLEVREGHHTDSTLRYLAHDVIKDRRLLPVYPGAFSRLNGKPVSGQRIVEKEVKVQAGHVVLYNATQVLPPSQSGPSDLTVSSEERWASPRNNASWSMGNCRHVV